MESCLLLQYWYHYSPPVSSFTYFIAKYAMELLLPIPDPAAIISSISSPNTSPYLILEI